VVKQARRITVHRHQRLGRCPVVNLLDEGGVKNLESSQLEREGTIVLHLRWPPHVARLLHLGQQARFLVGVQLLLAVQHALAVQRATSGRAARTWRSPVVHAANNNAAHSSELPRQYHNP